MNRNIRLLLLGANLWYVGEGMLGPLIGVFSQEIGGSVLDLTWAWSIYLIVTGICTGVIGVIADRGRATAARLMVVGYGLNALVHSHICWWKSPGNCFWCRPDWVLQVRWRPQHGMHCIAGMPCRGEPGCSGVRRMPRS
ncbi:MAG: MFS transporter [Oscillochloris sp.]|nr:MFS transporter [Oscillochloris sp.]